MNSLTRSEHAADRLIEAVERRRSPVCVGLDPVVERLPRVLRGKIGGRSDEVQALVDFSSQVLAAIAPHIGCVKVQAACFERYPPTGWAELCKLLVHARQSWPELTIILDAKRGDIGISAEHYAIGVFDGRATGGLADWLTINSYLGDDGITPFLRSGHGAFALVRTSNAGGDSIQNLQLQDGRTVAMAVGEMVSRIGESHLGQRGYSSLGAVVGATKPHDARRLREVMPQQVFLVPGYGAQGGGIDDVLPCFEPDGSGAIVTASRSVIYAFDPGEPNWHEAVADAAARFADDVGRAVGMRH